MENWAQLFVLAGILLIGIASFGFSIDKVSGAGEMMSNVEALQIMIGTLGLAAVLGGIWKK